MRDCADDIKNSFIVIVTQNYLATNRNNAVPRIIDMVTIVMSYEWQGER